MSCSAKLQKKLCFWLKLDFSAPQVGERKTGISELQPGHQQEGRQEQKQKTSYLKTAVIQLTFVKSSYISLMALNDFSLVSSSDSEASETEDYKLLYNLKAYQN